MMQEYELFNINSEEVEAVKCMTSFEACWRNRELAELGEPRRWTNAADEMEMAA